MIEKHWSELRGDDRAKQAYEHASQCYNAFAGFRQKCQRNLWRYEGSIDKDGPNDFGEGRTEIAMDITRAQVSTVVARVGALQLPKVQVITSDADWRVRRNAAKVDQFIDGLLAAPTGTHDSAHSLRIDCFRDAVLFGMGIAYPRPDLQTGRVTTERVLPWEICCDPIDARQRSPREVWRRYPLSLRQLRARYQGSKRSLKAELDNAEKYTAKGEEDVHPVGAVSTSLFSWAVARNDQVVVWEGWLLASPETANTDEPDGRHVVIVRCGGAPVFVVDEPSSLIESPFAVMYWDPPVVGPVPYSLADENAATEDAINRLWYRISDTIDRTAMQWLLIPEGAQDDDKKIPDCDAGILRYAGQVPPTVVSPPAISQSHLELVRYLRDDMFEARGISQMAATGERQPGVGTSGAAVRAVQSVQSQRFAWIARQNQQFLVQLARLSIAAVRSIVDEGKGFSVKAANKFLRSISWSDIDMDDDQFELLIVPIGESKGSPEDRLERAEELFARGLIPPASYLAMTSGTLDVRAEERLETEQKDLVEAYMERWLDAPEDHSMWFDEKNQIPYLPEPLKYLDLPAALRQVCLGYLRCEKDGAPDHVRDLFLQWMAMCNSAIEAQEKRKSELVALQKGGVASAAMMEQGPGPQPDGGMPGQEQPPAAMPAEMPQPAA